MIVEQRGEQGVRAPDRVEVTREMQIDVLHRQQLGVTAAGGASFHAEHRSETWLAHAQHRVSAEPPQRLRQSDRDRALAFTCRRRIHRGHQYETSAYRTLRDFERDLRLVLAVRVEIVRPESELCR